MKIGNLCSHLISEAFYKQAFRYFNQVIKHLQCYTVLPQSSQILVLLFLQNTLTVRTFFKVMQI